MRVVEPHEFKGVKHPKEKRRKGISFRLLVVIVVVAYIGSTFLRPLPPVTVTAAAFAPLQAKTVTINWPTTGQAAIGAVGYGVLGTHGEQTALPTASVAKVMTALAVLKQHPLKIGEQGPTITITQDDVNYYEKVVSEDGSNVPVVVDEEITEYQALQALLLPSSNNMAHTLARWSFGSEQEFTTYVNNFARSLGMTSAHFDDASGFSAQTVSNSEDLARLAVNAMDNPVIAEIAAQKEATIPIAGRIFNVNMLLGRDGIVGLKTGNTEQAGGCFMAAAVKEINGQKIVAVSVVMGADNLYQALKDSVPLINSVFTGFESTTLVKAGQTVGTYTLPWGGAVTVRSKNEVSGIVWRGSPIKPDVTLNSIAKVTNIIPADTVTGSVKATFGRSQAESPAMLTAPIVPAPLSWRLKPRVF